MHELSIAQSIVQLSEQQAREHHSSQIEEVELEIRCLAGVELQTLEFAMESAVKGTLLEKAKIIRRYVDGEGQCCDCLLYTSPSPRDRSVSRMPSSA